MNKTTVSSSRKNKGTIYIILMAFFTLVMIADLIILALIPARGTMDFSDFDPSSFPFSDGSGEVPNGQFPMPGGEIPEGFTPPSGEFPEGFSPPGGEAPDRFSPSGGEAPEGFSPPGGEAPEGFSVPEGEGFNPPENGDFTRPEGGFSFSDGNSGRFPSNGGQPFGGGNGFLSLVRRAWLPILIVCLLGNGVCLFLYIRLRRKSSAETQQLLTETDEGSEDDEDDEDSKKKKKGG